MWFVSIIKGGRKASDKHVAKKRKIISTFDITNFLITNALITQQTLHNKLFWKTLSLYHIYCER